MDINHDLLQFYIHKKLIKRKESDTILSEAKKMNVSVRDYLTVKEYITDTNELPALSEYFCVPYVEIDMLDIDKNIFNKFTLEFMKKNKFIPIKQDKNGTLIIACAKPLDCFCMSAVHAIFPGKIDFILSSLVQIDRYLDSVSAVISTTSALNAINVESDKKLFENIKTSNATTMTMDDVVNNPSVRLVDSVIKEAIPYRASDIHIEPFEKQVRVRYRIDGDLQERAIFAIESYNAICARIKILAGMDISERRIPQDGRINMTVGGKEYDFRVSTMPSIYGEKFVIRILDKSSFHFTREDLGFTPEENVFVDKMLAKPHGIILLTGPTGCGKSTTLYSFLKEVNDSKVNIITVEDPVEYSMTGITQTQVNNKANLTFSTALRSILRQDPDIIMIGEIRDEETAEIAVRSAITGHLVFSTLHTNDAPGAIVRLEDMGVPHYLVADALDGVIAQRLVKRICPVCRKRSKTNAREMEILGIKDPVTISRPQGCQFCDYTGYKGRISVHEIMYMNDELRNAVLEGKNLEQIRAVATKNGMTTLFNACKQLVLDGVTSVQELMTLNEE